MLLMDVDAIRSQFVQDNLRRAFVEGDADRRREILEAFRAYFEWFSSRFPDREKLAIQDLLAGLEALRTPSSVSGR
jgi:hypothetical protein